MAGSVQDALDKMYGGGGSSTQSALDKMYGGSSEKKKSVSWGGFFGNAVDELKELAGVVTVPYYFGKAMGHDLAAPITGESFQTDDLVLNLAKEFKNDYMHRYKYIDDIASNLVQGDFGDALDYTKKQGKLVYESPVSFGLDALTIASAGLGGIGKGAQIGAKASKSGSALQKASMKVAGLEKAGKASSVSYLDNAGKRPVVTKSGDVLVAKTRKFTDSEGNILFEKPLARSPYLRGKDALKESVLGKIPDESPMSQTRRGTRMAMKAQDRIAKRADIKLVTAGQVALKALDDNEKAAVGYIIQGIDDADSVAKLREYRVSQLDADGLLNAGGRRRVAKRAMAGIGIDEDIRRLGKAEKHILKPSKKMERALDAIQAIDAQTDSLYINRQARGAADEIEAAARMENARKTVQARKELVLRELGIDPAGKKRLARLSHVMPDLSKKKPDGINPRSINPKAMAEELASTGENFRTARYIHDPEVVVNSYKKISAAERVQRRFEYALKSIRTATPEDEGAIQAGRLHRFKPAEAQRTRRLAAEYGDFIENKLAPTLDELGGDSSEALALKELLDKAADDLAESPLGLVMDKAAYTEMTRQFAQSRNIIARFAKATMDQWRNIVLNLKGTFYVNNFLGNSIFAALAHPVGGLANAAIESLPARLAGNTSRMIREAMPDIPAHSGTKLLTKQQSKSARANFWGKVANTPMAAGTKAGELGAKLTDDNWRRGVFRTKLNKYAREYMKYEKDAGRAVKKADALRNILDDADAVDMIGQQMYGDMLDYAAMTEFERRALVPFYPFWAFTRSMAGRTIRLTLDEPWKMQVLALWGAYGIESLEDQVGEGLPPYMKGLIALDSDPENPKVFVTAGMNPFNAPIDTGTQIANIFGASPDGETNIQNPIVGMNPFIKAAFEAAQGEDAFTGQPIEGNGMAAKYFTQIKRGLPPYALYERMMYPSKRPNLERTDRQFLQSYMGIPTGTLNMANVRENNEIRKYYEEREKAMKEAIREGREERKRSLGDLFNG